MAKQSIRRLQHHEPLPSGDPKRYVTHHGYIVLRWKTPDGYREIHEHTLVAGRPEYPLQVHHRNGIKHDNRPENLCVLSPREHAMTRATFDTREAFDLYESGWSFPMLAQRFGVHQVTVMRALKNRGLQSRPSPKDKTHCLRGHQFTEDNTYQWRGHRQCKACRRERTYQVSETRSAS